MKQAQQRQLFITIGRVLLLALAYVLAGRLALLLAIPPGFASAIFPPVGIALAAILIWGYPMVLGVFLGSTLLNLSIAADSLSALGSGHLLVAAGIATGTCLQGLTASWLIRRLLGFPNALVDERSIFMLLLIGGPLSCLLSASIGSWVLYQAGLIALGALPFSVWTWWVGDSIGVLIAAPLMLILFAEPRPIWRSRLATVGLPLLFSCLLMVALFIRASEAEQNERRYLFQGQARLMSMTFQFRLQLYSQAVNSIERLHLVSSRVGAEDFRLFVAPILKDYPGMQALSWCAWVDDRQRQAFERSQRQQLPGFSIKQRNVGGDLVTAPSRPDYVPVTFIEPLAENRKAIGFDLSSEAIRRATLGLARKSKAPRMTAPLQLVVEQQHNAGFLLVKAVYGRDSSSRSLEGFAVAMVRMQDFVSHALDNYPRHEFRIRIEDISSPLTRVLYSEAGDPVPDYARHMIWQEEFEFGGRQLRLQIVPSTLYLQQAHSLQPWLVLAGGLLICALLGGFLLTMTGRAELIRHQVRQRTLELTAILDNAAEAILIFANNGRIDIANPAAAALFGEPGALLIGRQIRDFLPSLKLSQPAELQAMLGKSCERLGRHHDGHQMELEISLSHYALADRQHFICLARDISARKQVERLKSEFVSTVSHELRTPLTSIKGSLGLLDAGVAGDLSERGQGLVQMALHNADRLVGLVDDILDIEKLEFGQTGIQLNRCELQALLREAVEHSQGYADSYHVHLKLDTRMLPADSAVMADNLRLQQVIANLISNAVKFSPKGGTVIVRATSDHDQVRVSVIDRGPGIPDAFRSRIFNKFAQADSSDTRTQGGTGLGLSICKTLLERMNGQIGYETELGAGSTFYFDLPLLAKGK